MLCDKQKCNKEYLDSIAMENSKKNAQQNKCEKHEVNNVMQWIYQFGKKSDDRDQCKRKIESCACVYVSKALRARRRNSIFSSSQTDITVYSLIELNSHVPLSLSRDKFHLFLQRIADRYL